MFKPSFYFFSALLTLLIVTTGCGAAAASDAASSPRSLTVFAAASLTEAFTALAAEFERQHPQAEIALNFAGSQALRLQIEQGAAVDLLASANQRHMQALVQADLMQNPTLFTQNRLVVIVPPANPAAVESLVDLARPGLKLILAAPSVPVGRYARQTLSHLDRHPDLIPAYSERVLANLVSEEENVKGVVAKILLGEADAGIVYVSDVIAAGPQNLTVIEIPPAYNVAALYPVAVASRSQNPALARQFVEFIRSAQGQEIMAHHGFQPPPTPTERP